jgi:divalent metal cation (Fe/Co/Zn/Cd) transporter
VVANILTGSISIRADTVHSALDLVAAFVTFLGVRILGRAAYEQHSFGHGKAENITSIIVAGLIFAVACSIIYGVVSRLLAGTTLELIGVGIYAT